MKPVTPVNETEHTENVATITSPLNPVEARYFSERMQESLEQELAFQCGEAFLYLIRGDAYVLIVAFNFSGDMMDDSMILAQVIQDHRPSRFIPINGLFLPWLPFLTLPSLKRWRRGEVSEIKIRPRMGFELLENYLYG